MSSELQLMAYEMNPTQLDDQMELGTSPFRQTDDVDFEDLDPMHDPSVDNSMLDETEFPPHESDTMQADEVEHYHDDEMIDEEDNDDSTKVSATNFDQGGLINNGAGDEEILYDEEAEYEGITDTYATNPQDDYDLSNTDIPQDNDASKNQNEESALQAPQNTIEASEVGVNNPPDNDVAEEKGAGDTISQTDVASNAADAILHTSVTDFASHHPTNESNIDNGFVPEASIANIASNLVTAATDVRESTSQVETTVMKSDSQDASANGTNQEDESNVQNDSLSEADDKKAMEKVKIVYLGEEMSLFQPAEEYSSSTFFLSDSSLASGTLEKLLIACREVLGDSLGHEDELVLDIPALGLHIFEDSKYASNLTLAKVVEVYYQLCNNENNESPESLYCHLSSRVCLATQYTYLFHAAQEGKTFSEIAADYVDTPEAVMEGDAHQTEGEVGEQNQITSQHADIEQRIDNAAATHLESDQAHIHIETNAGLELSADQGDNEGSVQNDDLVELLEDSNEGEETEPAQYVEPASEQEHSELQLEGNSGLAEVEAQDEATQGHEGFNHTEQATSALAEAQSAAAELLHTTSDELSALEQSDFDTGYEAASVMPVQAIDVKQHEPSALGMTNENIFAESVKVFDDAQAVTATEIENGSVTISAEHSTQHSDHDEQYLETFDGDEVNLEPEDLFPDDEPGLDLKEVKNDVAPTTPSKQPASKRKAIEEEDELDLFEISTPEPKRTRSS